MKRKKGKIKEQKKKKTEKKRQKAKRKQELPVICSGSKLGVLNQSQANLIQADTDRVPPLEQ